MDLKSKDIKKGKSHKGRKILDQRAPQLIENPKKAIFIKGNKASAVVNSLMTELHILRGPEERSRIFMNKSHDIHPFDNIGPLEQMASKQDCSLFCLGSHQKKRPDNIVIGRTYDKRTLDMFEFGIENYKSMNEFQIREVDKELKPILIFQGEQFEFSEKYQRLKNLLYDFFHLTDLEETNIVEMKKVLVFTAIDDATIKFRQFELPKISEQEVLKASLEMREIGPHFDLRLRRSQIGSQDLFKLACKKPKLTNVEKKKARKNMFTTEIGDKKAKVFIQQQDLDIMATRKFKKQKP